MAEQTVDLKIESRNVGMTPRWKKRLNGGSKRWKPTKFV